MTKFIIVILVVIAVSALAESALRRVVRSHDSDYKNGDGYDGGLAEEEDEHEESHFDGEHGHPDGGFDGEHGHQGGGYDGAYGHQGGGYDQHHDGHHGHQGGEYIGY